MKTISFLIILISIFISSELNSAPKKVGILIYDGVYLMDFCGPLEIFNDTYLNDTTKGFEPILIAPELKPVKAHTGTLISPDYSISNCPDVDILVIPGGELHLAKNQPEIAGFIIKTDKSSELTMSVCTGAFILADLGLLNDKEAVTWYGAAGGLQKNYPAIKVKNGVRFTDNGHIITTAGVSAGVDGALHIVEKIYGSEVARNTAKYIEWNNSDKK